MDKSVVFLPVPQTLAWNPGHLNLGDGKILLILAANPQEVMHSARMIQQQLSRQLNLHWSIVASSAMPAGSVQITLEVIPQLGIPAQGYTLAVTPAGILIRGVDAAGVFYGTMTFLQLLRQAGSQVPCLVVKDWPDFAARGVMLDISRDKVPTQQTLIELIDFLASLKVNQVQLYTEHTFAYRNHPKAWENASPMTQEEIMDLDACCRERFIDLVPNQNSFGHLHHWLELPEYAHLAEVSGEFVMPWGPARGPFSLCPVDPASMEFLDGLYDELLPHFSSKMLNVGCDETWDVGQGRSKDAVEQRGGGRVYLDFLMKIYQSVSRRGKRMQFWGDIIIEHPELVPELPSDLIALEWGYEADHPFEEHGKHFAAAGIPFYVCPGTSAWNTIAGRTENAVGNLRAAAESGLKYGACGYLTTDWGDSGHWQTLPISYLGYAAGAAYSWALAQNRDADLVGPLSLFCFDDPSGEIGRLAYDLGNVYRVVGITPHNSSVLFRWLQMPLAEVAAYQADVEAKLPQIRAAIDAAMAHLAAAAAARNATPDSALVATEFQLAAQFLRHACDRAEFAFTPVGAQQDAMKPGLAQDLESLIANHQAVWLRRNRPGGLSDSLKRLEKLRADYR
jgi:hypothetical protein